MFASLNFCGTIFYKFFALEIYFEFDLCSISLISWEKKYDLINFLTHIDLIQRCTCCHEKLSTIKIEYLSKNQWKNCHSSGSSVYSLPSCSYSRWLNIYNKFDIAKGLFIWVNELEERAKNAIRISWNMEGLVWVWDCLRKSEKHEMKRHAKHNESITHGDVMVYMRFEVMIVFVYAHI